MYIKNITALDVRVVLLCWFVSRLIPISFPFLCCLTNRHMVIPIHPNKKFLKTCHNSFLATLGNLLSPN